MSASVQTKQEILDLLSQNRDRLKHLGVQEIGLSRYLSEESQHFTKAQFIANETAKRAFVLRRRHR